MSKRLIGLEFPVASKKKQPKQRSKNKSKHLRADEMIDGGGHVNVEIDEEDNDEEQELQAPRVLPLAPRYRPAFARSYDHLDKHRITAEIDLNVHFDDYGDTGMNAKHWPLRAAIREVMANALDASIESAARFQEPPRVTTTNTFHPYIGGKIFFDGCYAISWTVKVDRVELNPKYMGNRSGGGRYPVKYIEVKKNAGRLRTSGAKKAAGAAAHRTSISSSVDGENKVIKMKRKKAGKLREVSPEAENSGVWDQVAASSDDDDDNDGDDEDDDDYNGDEAQYIECENAEGEKIQPIDTESEPHQLFRVSLYIKNIGSPLPLEAWVNSYSTKNNRQRSDPVKRDCLIGGFGYGLKDAVLACFRAGFKDVHAYCHEPLGGEGGKFYRSFIQQQRWQAHNAPTLSLCLAFSEKAGISNENFPTVVSKIFPTTATTTAAAAPMGSGDHNSTARDKFEAGSGVLWGNNNNNIKSKNNKNNDSNNNSIDPSQFPITVVMLGSVVAGRAAAYDTLSVLVDAIHAHPIFFNNSPDSVIQPLIDAAQKERSDKQKQTQKQKQKQKQTGEQEQALELEPEQEHTAGPTNHAELLSGNKKDRAIGESISASVLAKTIFTTENIFRSELDGFPIPIPSVPLPKDSPLFKSLLQRAPKSRSKSRSSSRKPSTAADLLAGERVLDGRGEEGVLCKALLGAGVRIRMGVEPAGEKGAEIEIERDKGRARAVGGDPATVLRDARREATLCVQAPCLGDDDYEEEDNAAATTTTTTTTTTTITAAFGVDAADAVDVARQQRNRNTFYCEVTAVIWSDPSPQQDQERICGVENGGDFGAGGGRSSSGARNQVERGRGGGSGVGMDGATVINNGYGISISSTSSRSSSSHDSAAGNGATLGGSLPSSTEKTVSTTDGALGVVRAVGRDCMQISTWPGLQLLRVNNKIMHPIRCAHRLITSHGTMFPQFKFRFPESFKRTIQRDRVFKYAGHTQLGALCGSAIIAACKLERHQQATTKAPTAAATRTADAISRETTDIHIKRETLCSRAESGARSSQISEYVMRNTTVDGISGSSSDSIIVGGDGLEYIGEGRKAAPLIDLTEETPPPGSPATHNVAGDNTDGDIVYEGSGSAAFPSFQECLSLEETWMVMHAARNRFPFNAALLDLLASAVIQRTQKIARPRTIAVDDETGGEGEGGREGEASDDGNSDLHAVSSHALNINIDSLLSYGNVASRYISHTFFSTFFCVRTDDPLTVQACRIARVEWLRHRSRLDLLPSDIRNGMHGRDRGGEAGFEIKVPLAIPPALISLFNHPKQRSGRLVGLRSSKSSSSSNFRDAGCIEEEEDEEEEGTGYEEDQTESTIEQLVVRLAACIPAGGKEWIPKMRFLQRLINDMKQAAERRGQPIPFCSLLDIDPSLLEFLGGDLYRQSGVLRIVLSAEQSRFFARCVRKVARVDRARVAAGEGANEMDALTGSGTGRGGQTAGIVARTGAGGGRAGGNGGGESESGRREGEEGEREKNRENRGIMLVLMSTQREMSERDRVIAVCADGHMQYEDSLRSTLPYADPIPPSMPSLPRAPRLAPVIAASVTVSATRPRMQHGTAGAASEGVGRIGVLMGAGSKAEDGDVSEVSALDSGMDNEIDDPYDDVDDNLQDEENNNSNNNDNDRRNHTVREVEGWEIEEESEDGDSEYQPSDQSDVSVDLEPVDPMEIAQLVAASGVAAVGERDRAEDNVEGAVNGDTDVRDCGDRGGGGEAEGRANNSAAMNDPIDHSIEADPAAADAADAAAVTAEGREGGRIGQGAARDRIVDVGAKRSSEEISQSSATIPQPRSSAEHTERIARPRTILPYSPISNGGFGPFRYFAYARTDRQERSLTSQRGCEESGEQQQEDLEEEEEDYDEMTQFVQIFDPTRARFIIISGSFLGSDPAFLAAHRVGKRIVVDGGSIYSNSSSSNSSSISAYTSISVVSNGLSGDEYLSSVAESAACARGLDIAASAGRDNSGGREERQTEEERGGQRDRYGCERSDVGGRSSQMSEEVGEGHEVTTVLCDPVQAMCSFIDAMVALMFGEDNKSRVSDSYNMSSIGGSRGNSRSGGGSSSCTSNDRESENILLCCLETERNWHMFPGYLVAAYLVGKCNYCVCAACALVEAHLQQQQEQQQHQQPCKRGKRYTLPFEVPSIDKTGSFSPNSSGSGRSIGHRGRVSAAGERVEERDRKRARIQQQQQQHQQSHGSLNTIGFTGEGVGEETGRADGRCTRTVKQQKQQQQQQQADELRRLLLRSLVRFGKEALCSDNEYKYDDGNYRGKKGHQQGKERKQRGKSGTENRTKRYGFAGRECNCGMR